MKNGKSVLVATLVISALVVLWRSAGAQDPNNPPFDPHPLQDPKISANGSGSAMTTSGQYLYVLKGNRVYQIKTSTFAEERPRFIDLQ